MTGLYVKQLMIVALLAPVVTTLIPSFMATFIEEGNLEIREAIQLATALGGIAMALGILVSLCVIRSHRIRSHD